jgi:hypothetical protein
VATIDAFVREIAGMRALITVTIATMPATVSMTVAIAFST